jgi:L-amino acid N-acyltransferase YncA
MRIDRHAVLSGPVNERLDYTQMLANALEPITIRRARQHDLASIVDIWLAGVLCAFGITPPPTEGALRFFAEKLDLQTENFGIWVAVCEGNVIGWQGLYPCRNNPIEAFTVAEASTYVSPTSRAKGVGRALLVFAQEHATRVQLRQLRGTIVTTNSPSLKLVDSLGWSRVGAMPGVGDDAPAFFLYAYAVPSHGHTE